MKMGFLRYAQLLFTEARFGPNALNEARRQERELIVRWLRERAYLGHSPDQYTEDVTRQAIITASNLIEGGTHYRDYRGTNAHP
jgi:hypothetical protein